VGESSFWYRPTRVVPDQRPLNGRRRRRRFIRYRRVHHTVYMVFRLGRANLVSLLSLEPWGSLLELSSTQTTHQSLLTQMLQQSTRTLSRIRQVAPMCTPSNTWFLGFTRV